MTRAGPLMMGAICALVALTGCRGESSRAAPTPARSTAPAAQVAAAALRGPTWFDIPASPTPPKLDGELTEGAWKAGLRTRAFPDAAGEEARPFSEARFVASGAILYLGLYAADEDIEVPKPGVGANGADEDAFEVRFGDPHTGTRVSLTFSAAGGVQSERIDGHGSARCDAGITAAVDRDGTTNDPHDDDEEWVVEAAVPFLAIGAKPGAPLAVTVSRCDNPRRAPRRCGSWTGTLVLAAGRQL